jgi:hypothetical protein
MTTKPKVLGAAAALALVSGGCVWPSSERQLLLDFFQACRVYDTTVMARMATATCDPKQFGVVEEFEIENVRHDRSSAGYPQEEVALRARIRSLDGDIREHPVVATLEQVDDRWIVTALMQPPASRTSREASSVPLK